MAHCLPARPAPITVSRPPTRLWSGVRSSLAWLATLTIPEGSRITYARLARFDRSQPCWSWRCTARAPACRPGVWRVVRCGQSAACKPTGEVEQLRERGHVVFPSVSWLRISPARWRMSWRSMPAGALRAAAVVLVVARHTLAQRPAGRSIEPRPVSSAGTFGEHAVGSHRLGHGVPASASRVAACTSSRVLHPAGSWRIAASSSSDCRSPESSSSAALPAGKS